MNDPINAVADYGADPTGGSDTTSTLQSAINAGTAAPVNVWIPDGNYRVSGTLTAGQPYNNNGIVGWNLLGDGRGSAIQLQGTGLTAILQLDSSVWRYCGVHDLTLQSMMPGAATYGLLFNSTEFSGHEVARVNVIGASKAFAILQGTGGNGEFVRFENCQGNSCDTFFYSNAGQAYVQRFDHCEAGPNPGATIFDLEVPNGGGGLIVTDFNASCGQQNGIANSTLFQDKWSSSPASFIGGRIEKLTRIIYNPGGSPNNAKTVLFQGVQFTIDFDPTNAANEFTEVVSLANTADKVVFRGCVFSACSPTCTFPIYAAAGWGSLIFEDCIWLGFAQPPYLVTDGYDEWQDVHFIRCRREATNAPNRLIDFDRAFVMNRTEARPLADWTESQWVAAGMPGNLLQPMTIPPLAPGQNGQPGQSVYQDITALDLSTTMAARDYDGVSINTVAYRGKFTRLGGAAGTIALVDSVSGQVYDQFQIRAGGTLEAPVEISLIAAMAVRPSTCYVRLLIQNVDESNTLTVQPAWQFAEMPQ